MSDGHYCFVRDLGLVKGGKGMKHHEVIVDVSCRGLVQLFKRAFMRSQTTSRPQDAGEYQAPLREPS